MLSLMKILIHHNITPNKDNPPNEMKSPPNILLNGSENNLDTATEITNPEPGCSGSLSLITPASVTPFPKVIESLKSEPKRNKEGSTKILTDTPVKDQIEADLVQRILTEIIKDMVHKHNYKFKAYSTEENKEGE
ncbi:hypothetical protein JTB14_010425 [Gonioctena quinquepunctata]|nr:hypothetical protein JTB14_010425 [Gonioctena quinquepunctata]